MKFIKKIKLLMPTMHRVHMIILLRENLSCLGTKVAQDY